jgi:hypothetical protein
MIEHYRVVLSHLWTRCSPLPLEFWNFLSNWVRLTAIMAISASALLWALEKVFTRHRLIRLSKLCLEHAFNIAGSISHNYGGIISYVFGALSLIGFGLSLSAKLNGNHTKWYISSLIPAELSRTKS